MRCRKRVVSPRFSRVLASGFGLEFLRVFGRFSKLRRVSFPMVFGLFLGSEKGFNLRLGLGLF